MKSVQHLVVGAGIAGVYIGLQLQDKGEHFLILEKSGEDRGKQKTVSFCGGLAELGSSIVHSNQNKILGLGRRLGLTFSPLDKTEQSMILLHNYDPADGKKAFKAIRKKVEVAALAEGKKSTKTLDEITREVCTPLEAYIMKWGWDCWYENAEMNAFALFSSQKQEGDYMVCNEGLQELLLRPKLPITFNTPVETVEFDEKSKTFIVNDSITCKYLYITVDIVSLTKIAFKGIPYEFFKRMSCGQPVPSCRYYICLDKAIPTGKITSIVGDPDRWPFKWSLRVSPTMWLLSYVDGPLTEEIKEKREELVGMWCKYMSELFDEDISSSNVVDVVAAWWKDSFTRLSKVYYERKYQLEPTKYKFMNDQLICTSLPTVAGQAWMEGHLYDI